MKKTLKVLAFALTFVLLALALTSCAPKSDPDKALAALKKKEYSAAKDTTIIPAALTLLGVKGVDCVVSGSKSVEDKDGNKDVETVTIVYFTDKSSANDAWDAVKEYAEKDKDDDSDWSVKKSGKMIYWGTSAGIKAAS